MVWLLLFPRHSTSVLWSCLVSCSSFTVFLRMRHDSINQCTSTPHLFYGPVWSAAPASPCSCACVNVQSISAPALHLYFCGPVWSAARASPCSFACVMVQSISAPALLHLISVVLSGQLLQLHCVPAHASWFNQSVHQHSTSILWSCLVSCSSFTVFLCMRHGSINQYTSVPPLFSDPVWSAAPASLCSCTCIMVQSISAPALRFYSLVLSGQLLQLHRVPAHASLFNQSVHQHSTSVLWSCLVRCSSFTEFLRMRHGSINQCTSTPPQFCGPVWSAAPASPSSCACVMVQSISAPTLHLYCVILSSQLFQLHCSDPAHH